MVAVFAATLALVSGCGRPATKPAAQVTPVAAYPAEAPAEATQPWPEAEPIFRLRRTDVLPYPEIPLSVGRCVVYEASFAVAFAELPGAPRFDTSEADESSEFVELARGLEGASVEREWLSASSFAGSAAAGELGELASAHEQRLPSGVARSPEGLRDGEVAILAELAQIIAVPEPAERRRMPFRIGAAEIRVEGVTWPASAVERRGEPGADYQGIRWAPADGAYVVDAVTAPPGGSLEEVRALLKDEPSASPVADDARIGVPSVSLGVVRRYPELESRALVGGESGVEALSHAEQVLRFRFAAADPWPDGEGKLDEEWSIDRPFVLMVRRKEAEQPYLVVWIGSPELLTETGNPASR